MSEVLAETIGLLIMTLTGFYVIKNTTNSSEKVFSLKNMAAILLIIIPLTMYRVKYQSIYTIVTFLVNIIIYKIIFKETLQKTMILTCFVMILTFISDIVCGIVIVNLFDIEKLRSLWYARIALNVSIATMSILIFTIIRKKGIVQKLNNKIQNLKDRSVLVFFLLIIIVFTIITYNLSINFKYNDTYLANIILVLIFIALSYIFMKEKNNLEKLINEYDNLFNYIQNFEDWIEKEQLNRHEYKNQLAVLRTLSKNKKVQSKIDEILEDNINLEGEIINQLKVLPKGGIKGLMYYKLVIAQKNKIDLTVDVSLKKRTLLNKLTEKQNSDLCKLIGIYFDNAIEAAKDTKKKNVLVEIYELKGKVNIVISNTFIEPKKFKFRNQKGISSKGKGRGNGLYFAKKIISKSNWLKEKQAIMDGYYIEQISILKLEK